MTHIEIADITGAHWRGDSYDEPLSPADAEQFADLLSNFKELNHLSLEITGVKTYFNPAHIVAVSIHAED